jgi:phenylacetyl-CoA:acceptor oxidoreductase 26-kDa subunit
MSSVSQYGPKPWQQTSWDARAAANYIGGGMGGGLIVIAALSGVTGGAYLAIVLAALGLVALGLFSVALELGRPRRAWRVLTNVRTSWMSREGWTAMALFPIALAAALGVGSLAWLAAAVALFFIYCQARMLQAAKGIPAWREPLFLPLLVTSGLAEGAGVFVAATPFQGIATIAIDALLVALVLARFAIWLAYRRRVDRSTAYEARAALGRVGTVLLYAGTIAPVVLIGVAFAGTYASPIPALAGLLAAFAGAFAKLVIVTRAGFTRGFAIARMPVRGVRPKG